MEHVIRPGATAVVTGGGSGIGRGLVLELAGQRVNIVLAGRRKERLEQVADEARALGVEVRAVVCDVAVADDVVRLRDEAVAEFGIVDLVCLNAATTTAGPLLEHSLADWEYVYRSCVMGVVHGVTAFAPHMRAVGAGQILITGSIAGVVPDAFEFHGPYTSAKAAVHALALTLRAELAPSGIGVSLLVPAGTNSDMVGTSAYRPGAGAATAPDLLRVRPRPGLPEPLPGADRFLEPEEVARRAVSGLRHDLPIIVSHSGQRPMIEEFCVRVLDAFDEDRVVRA